MTKIQHNIRISFSFVNELNLFGCKRNDKLDKIKKMRVFSVRKNDFYFIL